MQLTGAAQLKASDNARGLMVIACFDAVRTPTDRQVFKEGSDLQRALTIKELHSRVIGCMLLGYSAARGTAPRPLTSWKELTVNSLTDRITEMDKALGSSGVGTPWKTRMTLAMCDGERANLHLPTKPTKAAPPPRKRKPEPAKAAGAKKKRN
ncbi:hypothetical protein M885DRAFT_528616 [Pelagophyceae sp. CCMP2097]|nr:hypothetical protein M885DRAFT_528616 [Pelagophyceae sp. CCMP2097]